jgi:DNA (cytosine-5)-methyltransferase 1
METVFQCEWDKHATKILERHWPHVPRWDDVSTLTGAHILQHAPVVDVVAWGSPCQDLSVAGKRAGLEGARSGLFHEGVRIIKELRSLTNGKYPRISIWENVAGALSSAGGSDFGQVLYEMDEAGACFSEWRLLDAQYFGVPQRRRRVFVVSVFDSGTAARCPDPLLPVSEGVRGDSSTGKQAGQEPAREVAGCLRSGGAGGVPSSRGEHLVIQEPILIDRAAYNQGQNAQFDIHISDDPVSPSLVARGPHAVATFTKGKRAQSVADDETWDEGRPAPTLNAFDQGDTRATTVIVQEPMLLDGRRVDDVRVYDPPVQTLQARMGTGGNNVPMLAFDTQFGSNANVTEDVAPTLKSSQQSPSVAFTTEQTPKYNDNVALTLTKGSPSGGWQPQSVLTATMAVRRLTPVECERLMGWPDGWTEGQADTHRYKQCGNGVASPVAEWIGKQLIHL